MQLAQPLCFSCRIWTTVNALDGPLLFAQILYFAHAWTMPCNDTAQR